MDHVCLQGHVSGRVQGVWFRAFVQREAQQRGVTGWVRNLPDGRVEVLVSGERSLVDELVEELGRGPRLARVDRVALEPCAVAEHQGFHIR